MPLQRIATLAVLLVHLFASVATGVVYLCQMSGQVGLSSCCCGHRPDDSADGAGSAGPAGTPDSIRAPGCCDASQIEANRAPSLTEKRTSERLSHLLAQPLAQPLAMAVLPATPGLRGDGALALSGTGRSSDSSRPGGPPIYLRTRALLL